MTRSGSRGWKKEGVSDGTGANLFVYRCKCGRIRYGHWFLPDEREKQEILDNGVTVIEAVCPMCRVVTHEK
jgi:hypothetical protein